LRASEPAGEILSVAKELGGAIGVPGEARLAGVKDVRVNVFTFSCLRVTLGEMHRSSRRFAKTANLLTMTPAAKDTVSLELL
jgi:hypothetical protein